MLESTGKDGKSLADVLRASGVTNPAAAVAALAMKPASILEYLELHIEQVYCRVEYTCTQYGAAGRV